MDIWNAAAAATGTDTFKRFVSPFGSKSLGSVVNTSILHLFSLLVFPLTLSISKYHLNFSKRFLNTNNRSF